MRDTTTMTHTHKGAGLARGPALVLGTILSAIGLVLLLKNGATPNGGFPDGDISGPTFFGVETNGWTAWLTTAAGALLLFGAAQHLLAKAMSLVVGLALLAGAVLGFVDGDVLGVAATNHWTELGWAVAGVLLLLNLFAPRRRDRDDDVVVGSDTRDRGDIGRDGVATEPVRRDETAGRTDGVRAEELDRRDVVGSETEAHVVHAGDPRDPAVVDGEDAGRRSSRFGRD